MSEVFHHVGDDHKYEVLNSINIMDGNSDIQNAIEEEREEQEIHRKTKPYSTYKYYTTTFPTTNPVPSNNDTNDMLSKIV